MTFAATSFCTFYFAFVFRLARCAFLLTPIFCHPCFISFQSMIQTWLQSLLTASNWIPLSFKRTVLAKCTMFLSAQSLVYLYVSEWRSITVCNNIKMEDFCSGISICLICRGITHTNTFIVVYVKYRLILGFVEEGYIFLWILKFSRRPTIILQPIMGPTFTLYFYT